MTDKGDIAACAGLVQRGDSDRFRAVMATPVALRRVLFPLYAFNLEVARAPWVTQEPMIAEMRLQWWRDALEEIASVKVSGQGNIRRHEVVTPLADAIDVQAARDLGDLIDARRADIEGLQIGGPDDLTRYVDRTSGTLLWTAARLGGMDDASAARDAGLAQGLANWLRAAPDLIEKGRQPLPPGDPEAQVRALAETGLAALSRFRQARVPKAVRPVFLVLSDTEALLRALRRDPGGPPGINPLASRLRMGWKAMTGRV